MKIVENKIKKCLELKQNMLDIKKNGKTYNYISACHKYLQGLQELVYVKLEKAAKENNEEEFNKLHKFKESTFFHDCFQSTITMRNCIYFHGTTLDKKEQDRYHTLFRAEHYKLKNNMQKLEFLLEENRGE